MDVRKKVVYEAPQADVVELKTEGIICYSPNRLLWILTDENPASLSSPTTEWGRSGYGSAESF